MTQTCTLYYYTMPSGNFYDENTLLKNIPENIMFNVLKKN